MSLIGKLIDVVTGGGKVVVDAFREPQAVVPDSDPLGYWQDHQKKPKEPEVKTVYWQDEAERKYRERNTK